MGPTTPPHEIALLRLVAQRLVGPAEPDAAAAVRWLTAMQAQDFRGVLTSVALRTDGGSSSGVEAALSAGAIVRSWPMRGTLHLVAAEDLRWLLDLTSSRQLAAAARRRAQLSIDDDTIERAGELAETALRDRGPLRRAELFAEWARGGVSTAGQRGYHLLWHLAQASKLCLGPVQDGEQLVVLVADWVRDPRRPDREESLAELTARYFRSHGPATVADLARWAGLPMRDVRAGIAVARPGLDRLEVDGTEYLLDPGASERLETCRRQARGVFLLPGFDELLLGYGDRSAVLPAEFADQIVPGGNGMFRATVISDGRAVGTWRTVGRGPQRTVEATPFTSFSAKVAAAIPRRHAALP